MRDVVTRLARGGRAEARDMTLLKSHLGALEEGLEVMRGKNQEQQRAQRAAAREKKRRAEERRFLHIQRLAEVGFRHNFSESTQVQDWTET